MTIPATTIDECRLARREAVFFDEDGRGKLAITGRDREKFLQGLLTQDMKAIAPGRGALACALTVKGKAIADMRVYALPDAFLLDVAPGRAGALAEHLRKYVIAAQVGIEDRSPALATIAVEGPRARDVLSLPDVPSPLGIAPFDGGRFLARASISGEDGWRLLLPREEALAAAAALREAGARPISPDAVEWLRIEAGVPLYGRDLDEHTLPPEAGLEAAAISYTKGCYLGQETIARLHFLGHINRRLMGLVFEGDDPSPPAGTLLYTPDRREIGRVTSPGYSPTLGRPVALGYVRREANAPGTRLFTGNLKRRALTVLALPLVQSPGSPAAAKGL